MAARPPVPGTALSPTLRVVDFEHSPPDLSPAAVESLAGERRVGRSELEDAFWHGAGRRPTADERSSLSAMTASGAGATVVWACEHGDVALEAHGRGVLAGAVGHGSAGGRR